MTHQVDRAGRRTTAGLALILSVQLMLILDMTVVNVALPQIRTDLGFTPSALSWVLNAYTLTFGGLLLLGGLAPSSELLVAARSRPTKVPATAPSVCSAPSAPPVARSVWSWVAHSPGTPRGAGR